jgi:hypothetical protein
MVRHFFLGNTGAARTWKRAGEVVCAYVELLTDTQYNAISTLLTVIALGALKLGVVMFYRRIFVSDWFKKLSLGVAIVIALWTVAFFFATVLECKGHNLDLIWKSIATFKQECYMYKDVQIGHCISDVITDLIVLSLPLPEIWKLNMTVRQKVVVSLIFLIGLLYVANKYYSLSPSLANRKKKIQVYRCWHGPSRHRRNQRRRDHGRVARRPRYA